MDSDNVTLRTCFNLPPNVNSKSMYHVDTKNGIWLNSSMPSFEAISIFIIAVSQALHFVLKRFGFPLFLSQLIAGILLVEAIIDIKLKDAEDSVKVLGTISSIGYAIHVFQIGVKTDIDMIGKVGKKAVYLGCFSIIGSVLCGLIAARNLTKDYKEFYESFLFLVITISTTSFPIVTSLLNELKIVNSELGRIGQSAAIFGDMLSMILINSMIVMRLYTEVGVNDALGFLGLVIAFIFIVFHVIRPAMKWIVRHTAKNGPVKHVYIYSIICIFLVITSLSKWVPQFIMAPYLLGLAIPIGPPLGSLIEEKFDGLTTGLFMPLFVATCGMRMDHAVIHDFKGLHITTNSILIGLTYLAKFGTCFIIAVFAKFPARDGCALALIMSAKGYVEMATISFLSDSKLIRNDLLCLMSIAVVIIGSFTPMLVKFLYDPSRRYTAYERRTLMHLSPYSNLQIVTCIHVPNHITAVANLLEVSGASGERPIGVHVLHLIKLSGQAAPVFISHDMNQQDFSDNYYYSENVIQSFTRFEANNWGTMSVNVFTSISAQDLMYQDICTLALDTSASLIVLPFHRRWYLDGSVESEDKSIRMLNRTVLDRAPCSVGILVDRGYKRRVFSSAMSGDLTQKVAMIFLGGNDDREALIYAIRMAEDHNVRLTVLRLICPDVAGATNWSKVLDSGVLEEAKSNRYIRYIEQEVKGGPETAVIIQSAMKEFDFFVVGRAAKLKRQQTEGLDEWMEYPELGVIGDLFATTNVEEKFSVLIVQQQYLNPRLV
ncbi:hypothetical protein ACFE04_003997 [Oxalis oulophora]